MGELVEIARVGDLAEGAMQKCAVQGLTVLLALSGGSYYAVDDRCPHFGASLSEGKLEGAVVTCPRHGSRFDLKDGRVIQWTNMPSVLAAIGKVVRRPRPLTTYAVKVEGERILMEM